MSRLMILVAPWIVGCSDADAPSADRGDVEIAIAAPTIRRGTNSFTMTMSHAHVLRVEPALWMPSMGHGAPSEPTVVKLNDTTYRLDDVLFSMPGLWELRVHVTCPHGESTRTFRYEVP